MTTNFSLSNSAHYMKETWSDILRNHYNSDYPLLARRKARYDLQGVKDHVAVPLSPSGGSGGLVNGYLPEGSPDSGDQMEITAKDHVTMCFIERKAMKAAMTDRGSFERFTALPVKKTSESHNMIANILWHQDGTARFCKTKSSTAYISGGATAPVIEMDSTVFFERHLLKNQLFNLGNSGDTGVEDCLLKITSVDVTNKRVTFSRVSGSYDVSSSTNADGRYLYLQNMFKAAPQGLDSAAQMAIAGTGSLYTINYDSQNWSPLYEDFDGAPPSISMINKLMNKQMTRVPTECLPTFLMTSPEIIAILSDIKEGDKAWLMPRDGGLTREAGFGFAGISYTTPAGKNIPIVADPHCKKTRIWGVYDEVLYTHHMPDFGWWDEDGQVFMRVPQRPWFSGTYGGFYENVYSPQFLIIWDDLGIDV